MNQVTPRSAIGGEVVYNREQLSTTDDADFNAQQVLVGVVYQYPVSVSYTHLFWPAGLDFQGERAEAVMGNDPTLCSEQELSLIHI